MRVQITVAGSPWRLNFVRWRSILCGSPVWNLLHVRLRSAWDLEAVPTILGNMCIPGVANAYKGRINTAYSPKHSYWSQECLHARINMPKIVQFCFLTWCTLKSKNVSMTRRATMHCVCVCVCVYYTSLNSSIRKAFSITSIKSRSWLATDEADC